MRRSTVAMIFIVLFVLALLGPSCRRTKPDICGLNVTTYKFGINQAGEDHEELVHALLALEERAVSIPPEERVRTCQSDWASVIAESHCVGQVEKYCKSKCQSPEQLEECVDDDSGAHKRCMRESLGPFKRAYRTCGALVLEGRNLKVIDRSHLPPPDAGEEVQADKDNPGPNVPAPPPVATEPTPKGETDVPSTDEGASDDGDPEAGSEADEESEDDGESGDEEGKEPKSKETLDKTEENTETQPVL